MSNLFARVLSRRSLWRYVPVRQPSPPIGPPMLALSFDLDYQADTDALDALVDLMARVQVRATLFSIGALVEADPEPYRRAAQAGHEIANHTQTHPDNPVLNPDNEFWHLSAEEMEDEIGRAQDTLERATGQRPTGFRTPHFKDASAMFDALDAFPEIDYVSTVLASQSPHRVPYLPARSSAPHDTSGRHAATRFAHHLSAEDERLLMIPLTPDPDHRWSPFCSYHAIRTPSNPEMGAGMHTIDEFESLWQTMLRRAHRDGFASVYFDPLDVMRDSETADAFERMLVGAVASGWSVATLADVARAWRPLVGGTS